MKRSWLQIVYFLAIIATTFSLQENSFALDAAKKTNNSQSVQKKSTSTKSKKATANNKTKKAPAKKTTNKAKDALNKTKTKAKDSTPRYTIPAVISSSEELRSVINTLINTANYNADIGVYVKSMRTGEVLYERNANSLMMPASTLKIMTAEAGLLFLGTDYRFSTQLMTDAKGIKNGVLQGNLYIVLNGDPTLTFRDVEELMSRLRQEQITGISGNVYIDNTAYDQNYYNPYWITKDKQYCYAAPISASIINHNCGLTGRVVTDVGAYDVALFKNLLSRLGVRVYGSVTMGRAPDVLSLINSHASKPLSLIVNDMLKKSDNIIAGSLFKKIGQLYTHQPGSWENGRHAVTSILADRAKMQTEGSRILDGSGLSPNNSVTPRQLMQVLDFANHHYGTSYEFISALPIAGVDGTLKHRMWNIARRVRAKTGTISGVASLAGYAVAGDKETLGFVIMINGAPGMGWRYKELEDRIATALTRYQRGN